MIASKTEGKHELFAGVVFFLKTEGVLDQVAVGVMIGMLGD